MPTRIPAGVGYHPFFFTFYMIPIDFKITIFSYTYLTFFYNHNYSERVHSGLMI